MNILFHPKNNVPWPAAPLGGWRTAHVNWADLEPEKGRWYFDLLDKYANWSQQHQVEILMPLTYTPRWASSTPDAPTDVEAGNPPGLSGAPRDMEDWRNFVRTVATRYRGRIHLWEIWNEPNRTQSWTGSPEALVAMTRDAARILKQIDPSCIVVSPAPTGTNGLRFFDSFLARGGGAYVDAIGYHVYVGHEDPPEATLPLIDQVKATMRRYGLGAKPLWNTEAGWLGSTPLTPEEGAAYLARAYVLNWADGVSRFYWYAWENHSGARIELTQRDNATLTPAGKAFVTIQRWMTGAVMTRCSGAGDGSWVCDLQRGGGSSHIVWNAYGAANYPLPAAWRARTVTSLAGASFAVQGPSIPVGEAPVLVQ
jgi:hypothetical protein